MKVIHKPHQFLTGAMYAPFCRTLAAPMEEWEQDIRNMKELGFNCIHGFAEWHHIEYEKGHFDFSQIDHMVECASRYGITVIVNVATQNSVGYYSPRWLMEELRETSRGFVDCNGDALPHSQFVVPCIDDPVYQHYAQRYLKQVAQHFGGDTRVSGYVLWGEPLLHRPGFSGSEICYCEHTLAKFRLWLKEKYGTVERLNRAWSTEGSADFAAFDQVFPPTANARQRGGSVSWDDWKDFMEGNLAGHIRTADRIFKENGALQPTITEMTTGLNQSIDPWRLAEGTDIIGTSCFGRPDRRTALYMSIAASMSKQLNKSTFVVEAAGGSVKYSMLGTPRAAELKSTLLQRAAYGVKGLMYWCWRPRFSDAEGGDFGLVRADGKPLSKTVEVGHLAARMNELADVYEAGSRQAEVVIFMSHKINHLMASEEMTENYCDALEGAFNLLTDLHISADFITEKHILRGGLASYKTLVLPCSYILSEECAAAIAAFVEKGGQVIADYLLAEKRHGGLCYRQLPGGELDRVFGIERDDVLLVEGQTTFTANPYGIRVGGYLEELSVTTAQVVHRYQQWPAVTENGFGAGTAVYFAGQLFKTYGEKPTKKSRELIGTLLRKHGVRPHASLKQADEEDATPLITAALFDGDSRFPSVLTVTNASCEPVSDTLLLPGGHYAFAEENARFEQVHNHQLTDVRFTLNGWESMSLYRT